MITRFVIFSVICIILDPNQIEGYNIDYQATSLNRDSELVKLIQSYVETKQKHRRSSDDDLEYWTGRWMPDRASDPTPPPKISSKYDSNVNKSGMAHTVIMGHKDPACDDAETNLQVDWDGSAVPYTCYGRKIWPDRSIEPYLYCEKIPSQYSALHKCMEDKLEYEDDIPTYGTHRPLWPVYGEYQFVPKQRWLHSLEHGAVVALYHPCANPLEIKRLKSLVKNCLRRHIITPYNLLNLDRPLALLTWGCRLTMSYVQPAVVKEFIRSKALKGPERISRDGHYKEALIAQAEMISDKDDSILCPK